MADLNQRVADGLRELADRAPIQADIWPAAEQYVIKHRRKRHALAGAFVEVALVGATLAGINLAHGSGSKGAVTHTGSTTPEHSISSKRPLPPLSAKGQSNGTLTITVPTQSLVFVPSSLHATTGVYRIRLVDQNSATANLVFDAPGVRFAGLVVDNRGQQTSTRAFFGTPGTYTFYCSIPGHRAAGQQGAVYVTGPTLTPSAAGR